MDKRELAKLRLGSQRLSGPPLEGAEAVVGWLGAVQSQEYGLAKWSIGQRALGVTDAALDELVAAGRIVRTHILRPTWHFVLPADIRWMMGLSGPRILARTVPRFAELGLDERTLARAMDVVRAGLSGGRRLTRAHIGAQLREAGIEADAGRLAYVVMHAELTLLICSGGLDGRQQTYALLDELVPASAPLSREEALAALVQRYFASHGPSTIADFTWWSTLTVADTRRGLEAAGDDLESFAVDGQTYWSAPGSVPPASARSAPPPVVHLLQAFDEYVVGYQRTRSALDADGLSGGGAWNPNTFMNPVTVDGQVVGGWRRVTKGSGVLVETKLLRPLAAAEKDALEAAVQRYAEFVGMPARLG